jgi:hypothetical protein
MDRHAIGSHCAELGFRADVEVTHQDAELLPWEWKRLNGTPAAAAA